MIEPKPDHRRLARHLSGLRRRSLLGVDQQVGEDAAARREAVA